METTSFSPGTLPPTTIPPYFDDTPKQVAIASFVGIAVVIVIILLLVMHCYNKLNPLPEQNFNSNRNVLDVEGISDPPTIFFHENKALPHREKDGHGFSHDVSIKLKNQWHDMYANMESEKFKILRDQLVESIEVLYKHYGEFKGANLLRLRPGSVIADLRLNFSNFAIEPLRIIKSAVAIGRCHAFEIEKSFFNEGQKLSRQSSLGNSESGYGSQENISRQISQRFVSNLSNLKLPPVGSIRRLNCRTGDVSHSSEGGQIHIESSLSHINAAQTSNATTTAKGHPNVAHKTDHQDDVEQKKPVESIIVLDQLPNPVDVTDSDDIGEEEMSFNVSNHFYENIPGGDLYENIPNDIVLPDQCSNGLYVVIFPFESTDTKELKLEIGDLIDVFKTSETGWWKGCCIRTNHVGWFPSTYVTSKSEGSDSDNQYPTTHTPIESGVSNHFCRDLGENKETDDVVLKGFASIISSVCDDSEDITPTGSIGMDEFVLKPESQSDELSSEMKSTKLSSTSYSPAPGSFVSFCEPPAKPVPPKPRKLLVKQTYEKLVAECRFGSSNEPIEFPEESSKAVVSRQAEDIFPQRDNITRYLQLPNKYVSHMMSWPRPSPNRDQMQLSQDDDRSYLEPISEKNKLSPVDAEILSEFHIENDNSDDCMKLNRPDSIENVITTKAEHCEIPEKMGSLVENDNEIISTKINETNVENIDVFPLPQRDMEKYRFSVEIMSNDEMEQEEIPYLSENICTYEPPGETHRKRESTGGCANENTPPSTNIVVNQDEYECESSQIFLPFECVNEEGEQVFISKNSILMNSYILEKNHKLSSLVMDSCGEEEEDDFSFEKASSTFSLDSLDSVWNSSTSSLSRSTTSSRHDQMNMRRATMNVQGLGDCDLSYAVGALLFELRPRNKIGLCYGILEDSTQGWYPAESVETF